MEFIKERIFGNLVTTVAGLVVAALVAVGNKLQANPIPLVYGLAPIVAAVGAYLRDPAVVKALTAFVVSTFVKKSPDAPPPPPPAAPTAIFFALALGAALLAASPARAQDVPPAPEPVLVPSVDSPLCIGLGKGFSLHLNVSAGALAYDFTARTLLGQVQFTGMEAVDYRELVAIGFGLSVQSGDTIGSTFTGMLAGPAWPITAGLKGRPAIFGQWRWIGGSHDWIGAVGPSFQF